MSNSGRRLVDVGPNLGLGLRTGEPIKAKIAPVLGVRKFTVGDVFSVLILDI